MPESLLQFLNVFSNLEIKKMVITAKKKFKFLLESVSDVCQMPHEIVVCI